MVGVLQPGEKASGTLRASFQLKGGYRKAGNGPIKGLGMIGQGGMALNGKRAGLY